MLTSPREVVANLVLFNLERPVNGTSALIHLPDPLVVIAIALTAAVALGLAFRASGGDPKDVQRVGAITALSLSVFLLGGKAFHRIYLLWVLPAAAVALATALWSEEKAQVEADSG